MSKRASPQLIGAFVVGAVVLLIAAILVFGSGRFFEESERFVIYFDESIVGLSIGAPVIFRGVEVGNVIEIKAVIKAETLEVATPIYVEIIEGRVEMVGPRPGALEGVRQLVEQGMRAQLGLQSFVTGKLFVNMVHSPDKPAVYTGFDPRTPEIPAIPSELEAVKRAISELPLEDLVDRLLSTVAGIDALVKGPEIRGAFVRLDEALTEARDLLRAANEAQLVADADAAVDEARDLLHSANEADVGAAVGQLRTSLASAESAMQRIDQMLAPGSPLQYELERTLQELQRAASGVAALTEQLSREPDSLIRGRRGGDR